MTNSTVSFDDSFDAEEVHQSSGKKKGLLFTVILLLLLAVIAFVIFKDPFAGSKVKPGSQVTFVYTATFVDGSIYKLVGLDSPVTITLGSGTYPATFENELSKIKVGSIGSFTVSPDESAKSRYSQAKLSLVPKLLFSKIGEELELNTYYDLGGVKGVAVSIEGASGSEMVVIDTNPLETWQDITYEVQVLK